MPDRNTFFRNVLVVSLFLFFAGIGTGVQAQDQGPMTIQANAMGTSTQLGQMLDVNIHIDQFSTQEERKALIDAFRSSGQNGLRNALEDLKGKGRFRTPYGVGNQLKYIFEMPPDEKGRRHIRIVTDRRIAFAELQGGTRSADYDVGVIDLFLSSDGKDSEGTALPAVKLKVSKKTQQIEAETYQNPWKLTNLRISKD
jgi:hypothetical protein